MPKIAVIKTGGKQYVVKEKQALKIEKLNLAAGQDADLEVLMTSNEDGSDIKIGTPNLQDLSIKAKILEHGRGKKIRVVHYKAKVRHHKVYGHRQPFTKVEINKI